MPIARRHAKMPALVSSQNRPSSIGSSLPEPYTPHKARAAWMSLTSSVVIIVNGSVACDWAAGSEGASTRPGLPPHRCRGGDTGDWGGWGLLLLDGGAVGTGSLYSSCSFRRSVGLIISDYQVFRLRLTSEAPVSWRPCHRNLAGGALPGQQMSTVWCLALTRIDDDERLRPSQVSTRDSCSGCALA